VAGDTGQVFDANEAVCHFNVGLVDEIDEEVVMWLRGDEGGCHSKVPDRCPFMLLLALSVDVFYGTD
jgi:hypothetical protein